MKKCDCCGSEKGPIRTQVTLGGSPVHICQRCEEEISALKGGQGREGAQLSEEMFIFLLCGLIVVLGLIVASIIRAL